MYANIVTQEQSSTRPDTITIGGVYYPRGQVIPESVYQAAGWRGVASTDPTPSGMLADSYTAVDNGDGTCHLSVATSHAMPPPPPPPTYTVPPEQIPLLQAWRAILRRNFPASPAPEADPTITQETVIGHFLSIANPTAQQASDQTQIMWLYQTLAMPFGGDMNNVPWSAVP